MPYSKYTFVNVKKTFGLEEKRDPFTAKANPITPSAWLIESLDRGQDMALFNEKSRSEMLITPILVELQNANRHKIGVYSGANLETDPEVGLSGECDFLITKGEQTVYPVAPIFCLIEAKEQDIKAGLGQCVAQMISAKLFNEAEGQKVNVIYGCVTTGEIWQFLRLQDQVITIDPQHYFLKLLDELLGVLQFVVDSAIQLTDDESHKTLAFRPQLGGIRVQ